MRFLSSGGGLPSKPTWWSPPRRTGPLGKRVVPLVRVAEGRRVSSDGRAGIDAGLVGRLVADQFPQWGDLPVVPVEADGWDNRTYRLGSALSVRLPTAEGYVPAVLKEHRWLPVLAPQLPLPVPESIALGEPTTGF